MEYVERFYRNWVSPKDLTRFIITEKESDLFILCDQLLQSEARAALLTVRHTIETFIGLYPAFQDSLEPLFFDRDVPEITGRMLAAGQQWHVGPMAAVAGAVAEYVGRALLSKSDDVIVENGGDIFMRTSEPVVLKLYAGEESPFKDRISFRIFAEDGIGVCTSSKKVGPSLSFGMADAVVAMSDDTIIADAAATSLANRIKCPDDVQKVTDFVAHNRILTGFIACCGDKLGIWGNVELVQ